MGKQGRAALRLVQDGTPTILIQKTTRIRFDKFPLVEILKRHIAEFGKRMLYQGGLAGLAWTRNHKHWIAVGEVFESGFRVSGDVGHGGFWLLYMTALCGIVANYQCYCQLAR